MTSPTDRRIVDRLNLMISLMVAGWLVLLLILGVAVIVLGGRLHQAGSRMAELEHRLVALEQWSSTQPETATAAPAMAAASAAADATNSTDPTAQSAATQDDVPPPSSTSPYNVSPLDDVPRTADNRPAGLAGWFHDVKHNSRPDDDSPFTVNMAVPRFVQPALAEIARVEPFAAKAANVPADQQIIVAQLFLQTGREDLALLWASAVKNDDPANGRAWLICGRAALAAKQYPQAVALLAQAAKLLPDRPEPLTSLGEAYLASTRTPDAVAAYRKASEMAPKDLAVASRLADLLLADGKTADAIDVLRRVVRDDPRRSADRARLAKLLVAQNKPADAVALLDAVPPGTDEDYRLPLARGHALHATGDLKGAEAAFDKAADINSLSAEVWHFLGLVRLKQGKNGDAVIALERSIAIDSTMPQSWEYLGVALANEGRMDDAVSKLLEAIRLNVASAQTHYVLAVLQARRGQNELTVAALREAIRLDPSFLTRARKEVIFADLPADNPIARFLRDADAPK